VQRPRAKDTKITTWPETMPSWAQKSRC